MVKIVVGPINKGLKTNVTPFNIDNDSFPTLVNAYQWRSRIKRKRGTSLLGRLQRYFDSTLTVYNTGSATITLDISGNGNIITGFGLDVISPNASIVPGSVQIQSPGPLYLDVNPITGVINGNLFITPSQTIRGTVNYSTGDINLPAQALNAVSVIFQYYPDLPVMGLEELRLDPTDYPGLLAFDTRYSYNITITLPYDIYDVTFYKNPDVDAITMPGYVPKTVWTPFVWDGEDYQQFWTTNYQKALWATNGIDIPFSGANSGMQFRRVTAVSTIVAGPPAFATFTIANHGLVVGDFLFFNEFDPAIVTGLNFQTGYVTVVVDANNVTVEFPFATLGGAGGVGLTTGIAQYLTSTAVPTVDGIRFYDGDPTNGSNIPPTFRLGHGWVNFAPPLSQFAFSVANLPLRQYYLVDARMIVPFKDRLLFIGPVVQASTGAPIYLQDTVIFSQNGTAYYTASFTGDASLVTTTFHPLLVPDNQTATANAYWEDVTGYGGYITAGLDQPIVTVEDNEDVLIMGFDSNYQTRFVYTGNDVLPFSFYQINSDLGASSTFSVLSFDEGVMTSGSKGFVMTNQSKAERFDTDILDQIFEIRLLQNGAERVTAIRDFINEWIYFTYPSNTQQDKFNNQTLLFNYRENTWSVFNESYTTYGPFRRRTGFTWSTVGNIYPTWSSWNDPWNAGESTLLQPEILGGNQQGFVLFRDEGTGEGNSLYIQNIVVNTVTSPDHTLIQGDYIQISGALGTVGTQVNGKIFSVSNVVTQDTFELNPPIVAGTYLGAGVIKKLYVPQIQTKQFPVAWDMARKTRIGVQQYLLSKTAESQITLLIFLSQNDSSPYNTGPISPDVNSVNDSLIYSTVLYTCPESTNLGLTPANTNLNMVTANQQNQIWHRINTSLLGDTVQLGFTLSDAQMRALAPNGGLTNQTAEIELHGFIIEVTPSMILA